MRFRKTYKGLTVQAVTGTHVVMLGFNVRPSDVTGLLGFAIHRTDPTEDEAYWLPGMRTFAESYPNPPAGALVSTQEHPIQDFLWSDFTAKPGRSYTYRVVPVYGRPKNLKYGEGLSLDVKTENELGGTHSVFFNRAVIGSEAYSRRFKVPPQQLTPDKKKEAYEWLSRGLFEAMQTFIGSAKDTTFGLRAAVYEFDYEPIVAEFAKAQRACQDVRIVYDARIPVTKQGKVDESAKRRVEEVQGLLAKHGLTEGATPRKANPNFIAHNKFIVLLKNDKPIAVWTGSTNFSESGIFGHANVGHLVRDKQVAARYLEYWQRLQADPDANQLRQANEQASPTLQGFPPPKGVSTIFSPRSKLDQLAWYATALDDASNLTCFTAAFGVNEKFLDVFQKDKEYLRYLFLEKWGVTEATAQKTEATLGADRDIQVAVGATLKDNVLYRWLNEVQNTLSRNVKYVHTKFLLVDPLSDDPIVISGSANFSDGSTKQNDENMLVVRGDLRVADIYLGEFMRLWRHHRFRFIVNKISATTGLSEGPNYLDSTSKWTTLFYKEGTVKFKRRMTFAPA